MRFEHPRPRLTPGSLWGGGDYCLARQPPILPSSRQTKGMDASQTECLNLAGIKGLNRKSQSSRGNFNEAQRCANIGGDNVTDFFSFSFPPPELEGPAGYGCCQFLLDLN